MVGVLAVKPRDTRIVSVSMIRPGDSGPFDRRTPPGNRLILGRTTEVKVVPSHYEDAVVTVMPS